mmetsp:Transcript_27937/g.85279  ORF Transcript_27937/g.85279 Transcript_27937/m.85279 type:complete len:202 (-) Transcript_27937:229-834(-)
MACVRAKRRLKRSGPSEEGGRGGRGPQHSLHSKRWVRARLREALCRGGPKGKQANPQARWRQLGSGSDQNQHIRRKNFAPSCRDPWFVRQALLGETRLECYILRGDTHQLSQSVGAHAHQRRHSRILRHLLSIAAKLPSSSCPLLQLACWYTAVVEKATLLLHPGNGCSCCPIQESRQSRQRSKLERLVWVRPPETYGSPR